MELGMNAVIEAQKELTEASKSAAALGVIDANAEGSGGWYACIKVKDSEVPDNVEAREDARRNAAVYGAAARVAVQPLSRSPIPASSTLPGPLGKNPKQLIVGSKNIMMLDLSLSGELDLDPPQPTQLSVGTDHEGRGGTHRGDPGEDNQSHRRAGRGP